MDLLLESADNSSLLLAAWSNRVSTVDFLMENLTAANVQAKDQDGNTALHLAALHGYCNLVKHLVDDIGAGLFVFLSLFCLVFNNIINNSKSVSKTVFKIKF
jgi:ankyrin repeat protein